MLQNKTQGNQCTAYLYCVNNIKTGSSKGQTDLKNRKPYFNRHIDPYPTHVLEEDDQHRPCDNNGACPIPKRISRRYNLTRGHEGNMPAPATAERQRASEQTRSSKVLGVQILKTISINSLTSHFLYFMVAITVAS